MPRLETKRDELVLLRSASDDVGSVEGYDVAMVIIVGLPCDAMTETGSVGVDSVGVDSVEDGAVVGVERSPLLETAGLVARLEDRSVIEDGTTTDLPRGFEVTGCIGVVVSGCCL